MHVIEADSVQLTFNYCGGVQLHTQSCCEPELHLLHSIKCCVMSDPSLVGRHCIISVT